MKRFVSVFLVLVMIMSLFCVLTVAAYDQQPTEYSVAFRRPVPKKFEKSSDFTDGNLLYFAMDRDPNEMFAALPKGVNYVTDLDLLIRTKTNGNATSKIVSVSGQKFIQALEIKTSKVINNSDGTVNTHASNISFTNTLEGCEDNDLMLVKFSMKTLSGGNSNKKGSVIMQIQGTEVGENGIKTYPKSLFETVEAGSEWCNIYLPFTYTTGRNEITIRVGTNVQTIQIADFEIINYSNAIKSDGSPVVPADIPISGINYDELKVGAQWRKDAIERIEDIRKGDINITVTDSTGYPVADADIDINMYEHEFQFGTAVSGKMFTNSVYQEKLSENFNTVVAEHWMKWDPLENQNGYANGDKMIEYGKSLGIKYFRGHALIWERQYGSDGVTNLTPDYMFTNEMLSDEEASSKRVIQHIKEAAGYFAGELCDWDVVNEIVGNYAIRNNYSDPDKAFVDWFAAARESDPYADLYYNETNSVWTDSFFVYLDMFKERNVDYDGIGIQSHYDSTIKNPTEVVALYKRLRNDYGKRLKVTEYSCSKFDELLQANFTRDMLIAAFAEENMDGFLYWGFWDDSLFADISPFYDKDWNLRGAGQVYQDLVYNKWWTRESGKTDSMGKYNLKAYYGDYDVIVTTADGYSEAISFPAYKNSDGSNSITIQLSNYTLERKEKDIFSFVHSGKIQIKGKILLPEENKNPDYMTYQASLLLIDDSKDAGDLERIMHITQVPINANGEYEIEFKADNLDYGELMLNGCHVLMNVNGEIIEENIATVSLIPDCVAFDVTPSITDGKLNVAIDFTNKLKRSGIDYTIYTAIYGNGGKLVSMSRVDKSSNGDASEGITLPEITLKDGAESGKILIWLNSGKMIPLTAAEDFGITN